jgi:hypothetical protein
MQKIIEFDEQCNACKGTGIYVGIAERDRCGIICRDCKGTGKVHFVHEYEEFTGIIKRNDVDIVVEDSHGITIDKEYSRRFKRLTYRDWLMGKPFEIDMTFVTGSLCPIRWLQSIGLEKKKEIHHKKYCRTIAGQFSDCSLFSNQQQCWKIYNELENQLQQLNKE